MGTFKSLKDLLDNQYQSPNSGRISHKKNQDNKEAFDFLQLVHDWPEIVGPRLSSMTIPLKIQRNKLVILTGHSAFAEQLSFMSNVIIEKINTHFPSLAGKINQINYMTNPTHFKQQKEQAEHTQEKKVKEIEEITHKYSPTDKALIKEANSLFEEIEDEDVKKSLTSIFIQLHKST